MMRMRKYITLGLHQNSCSLSRLFSEMDMGDEDNPSFSLLKTSITQKELAPCHAGVSVPIAHASYRTVRICTVIIARLNMFNQTYL